MISFKMRSGSKNDQVHLSRPGLVAHPKPTRCWVLVCNLSPPSRFKYIAQVYKILDIDLVIKPVFIVSLC